jgi:hypothetical protein
MSTLAPTAPRVASMPPLQSRTPEQLKEGLVVNVKGVGSEDLAVARLIQDGAQFMARQAGTTMGLTDVTINDRSADRQGALGIATFYGNKGWFGLSERSTRGVMEGIARLREKPFGEWSEAQRQAFIQANETILHESAHVTLNAYDSGSVNAWRSASRPLEEGISEVATMASIVPFMKEEFGVEVPELSDRISQTTSAYTRYSERIRRLLAMGTDGSPEALRSAAAQVGDAVRADQRQREIARRIGARLAGEKAPEPLVEEIARTIDGFIDERNGTRTKLMELQAALVDVGQGKSVDVDALMQRMRDIDAQDPSLTTWKPEEVGNDPIA